MELYAFITSNMSGNFNGIYAVLVSMLLLANSTLALPFPRTSSQTDAVSSSIPDTLPRSAISHPQQRKHFTFAGLQHQFRKLSGRFLRHRERFATPKILVSVLRTRRSIDLLDSIMMEKQIKLISQAVLDLQYRSNDTYIYYCHRQRDQIPKDAYPSCDDFAQTFAQYFGLPEIVQVILDPTSPTVNDDLAIALNRGLRVMTQYKHIINRVYEMEHRVVCTLYTLGGNPCPSHTCPEGEVHHPNRFLCELEKVSQRIEAFLANLKYVMQNLNVKIDGVSLSSNEYVPPKITTESARMAYTFASIHRLVEQSGQLKYDSVIE